MRFLIVVLLFLSNICYANDKNEQQIIIDYITNQFKGKSVSQKEIEKAWQNVKAREKLHMARFQIVNQKLYANCDSIHRERFRIWINYLERLLKNQKINDVDFIIYLRDEIPNDYIAEEVFKVPSFMMSKNLSHPVEKTRFLLPDAFMIKEHWQKLIKDIESANSIHKWEQKENKVFWRGATTGKRAHSFYNITNIDKLPRLKLVILSKLYPKLIDAQFTSFSDFSENKDGKNLESILITLFGKNRNYIKEAQHLKYKYLIALDGNTSPWLRVPWIMFSNSLLIKQETNNIEWFYPALKAYVHYVPIKEDLTDIFIQFDWLKANDHKAKQISLNSQNFVKNNLLPEHIDNHIKIILNEYSKIQTDESITPSLPKSEEVFSILPLIKTLFNQVKRKWID